MHAVPRRDGAEGAAEEGEESVAKNVALLTIHGMGRTRRCYAEPLMDSLRKGLGSSLSDRVYFGSVFYQNILQPNQSRVFKNMKEHVDWMRLREFLLYGFSDAASIESGKDRPCSVYDQVQERIMQALDDAFAALGCERKPVVVVAQSLGGQVISNYIWDSQKRRKGCFPNFGAWREERTKDWRMDSAENEFRCLKSLRALFTTGCNIPIFVAGHDRICAVCPPNSDFEWKNYYDEDDVLGWPLQPLSESYCELVQDHQINVGGHLLGHVLKSWNPLSHEYYWGDRDFLNPLLDFLKSLVNQS